MKFFKRLLIGVHEYSKISIKILIKCMDGKGEKECITNCHCQVNKMLLQTYNRLELTLTVKQMNLQQKIFEKYATLFSTLFNNNTLIFRDFNKSSLLCFQSRLLHIFCMWESVTYVLKKSMI